MKGPKMATFMDILAFIIMVSSVQAKLPLCSEDVNTTQFCQLTEQYPITPLVIKPWFQIMKIIRIHEDAKFIKVYFTLMLRWNDTGVIVKTPDNKP